MLGLTYPVSYFSTPAEVKTDETLVGTLSDQISEWNQLRWTTS